MGNQIGENVNARVFNGLVKGFLPSIETVSEWSRLATYAEVDGYDDDCIEDDPGPVWINGHFDFKKTLREYEESIFVDEVAFMKDKLARTTENLEVFIESITKERPNETYILFGRDCWPLSVLMKMKGIKHYYIEGASRNIVRNKVFQNMVSNFPCTTGSVLIDTGYAGSVPCGYISAHGVDSTIYANNYTIRLMCADIEKRQANWQPIGYNNYPTLKDRRFAFCDDLEMFPKFFSRPIETDSYGYPILRVCRTAKKAFGYYLMMLEYGEKCNDKAITFAA